MEERRKGTGDLLLPPEPRFQMSVGKGGQKKKKKWRKAGKEGERSGTRRNWLPSGGEWVAKPAKLRGRFFK